MKEDAAGESSEHPQPFQQVWRPKVERLRLAEELPPGGFEKLVELLASDIYSGTRVEVHRFGKSGTEQDGIDVIALGDPRGSHCFEAKRVGKITPAILRNWVKAFLDGRHAKDAWAFTLCTTYALHERPKLIAEWEVQRELLKSRGIEATLWDDAHLQFVLRRKYAIVCEIAGDLVAHDFCTEESGPFAPTPTPAPTPSPSPSPASAPSPEPEPEPESDIASSLQSMHLRVSGRWASAENTSVSAHVLLPGEGSLATNATLSFARANLAGITIGVSDSELVRWAQWARHTGGAASRPYAMPVGDGQRHVFTGRATRFVLRSDEVAHLDWLLASTWQPVLDGARTVLRTWRCEPFAQPNTDAADPSFEICSINEDLWRLLRAFVKAHDFEKGTGPWHLFDATGAGIKVYNKRPTAALDAGYHVFLEAERRARWTPSDGWLTVIWKPQQGHGDPRWALSPREHWDATYAHDWLLEELVPAALAWHQAGRDDAGAKPSFWQRASTARRNVAPVDLDGRCHSLAIPGAHLSVVPSNDIDTFRACVEALQHHFAGRQSIVPVAAASWTGVLVAAERLSHHVPKLDERYLRSKLDLPDDRSIPEGLLQLAASVEGASHAFEIDFALRALIALSRDLGQLPRSVLSHAANQLQPLLDRFHEDLIHDRYVRSS